MEGGDSEFFKTFVEQLKKVPPIRPCNYSAQALENFNKQKQGQQSSKPIQLPQPEIKQVQQGPPITLKIKNLKKATDYSVTISNNAPIEQLKKKIQELSGIPSNCQSLVLKGKSLANDKSLADYSIAENALIHLIEKAPEKEKDFWSELQVFLKEHLKESEAQKVFTKFQDDYNQMINHWSVEDCQVYLQECKDGEEKKERK